MPIQLIACDFDDTLTEGYGRVLPAVVEALRNFVAGGGTLLVASGRITLSLERFIENWNFPVLLAGANGTVLKSLPERRVHVALSLAEELAKEALLLADGRNSPYLFFDNRFYASGGADTERYSRLLKVPFRATDDIAAETGPGIRAVILRCSESETPAVKHRLDRSLGGTAYVTMSHRLLVDVNPIGAGKDRILSYVQNQLGITDAETMAVGDSSNDLGLINNAAFSAAVANGSEELKSAASYIAGTPRGEGVLECLRHFGV